MRVYQWDASKATYWQEIEAAFESAEPMDLDDILGWIGRSYRVQIDDPHLRAMLSKIPNDARATGRLTDPMYDDDEHVTQIGSTHKTWVYTMPSLLH